MKWWGWSRLNEGPAPRPFVLVSNSERGTYLSCMDHLVTMFVNSGQIETHTLVAVPADETPTKGAL